MLRITEANTPVLSQRAGGPNGRPYIPSPKFAMPHHHPRPLATNLDPQKNRKM